MQNDTSLKGLGADKEELKFVKLSDGSIAVRILSVDSSGEESAGGGGGGAGSISAYSSAGDFTASYASASTITLSGLPIAISDASQIAYVKVIHSDNTSETFTDGFGYSSGVVTIYDSSGVAVTTLASGDVYEVGLNAQDKAYDPSTNSQLNSILNPDYAHNTDSETLVTAQDLTASYADFGAEIDVQDYKTLSVNIVADCNNSQDVTLKILVLDEIGGSDEYELETNGSRILWSGAGTDFKKSYQVDVDGLVAIQFQAIAGTVGATAGDLTLKINKQ